MTNQRLRGINATKIVFFSCYNQVNEQTFQEMFTIVSCFEVALRNAIDNLLVPTLGRDWLKDSVQDDGMFSNGRMNETRKIIEKAYNRLN